MWPVDPLPRLMAAAAAVVAASLGGTPAHAVATWTVQPGGPVSVTSGVLTLTDTKTGVELTCPSVPMRGTLKSGSGLPGTGIGSITSVGFPQCGHGLPPSPTLTAAGLPWHVNVTSYNATKGVVTGRISHVRIQIKPPPELEPPCHAVVSGTSGTASDGMVRFTYADATSRLETLTSGGGLHFYHVRKCAGLLGTGDPATLSVTLTVSPKQAITSP